MSLVLTLLTGQVLTTVHTVRVVGAAVAVVHTGGIRHTAFLVVESKLLQEIISVVKALAIFDEKALRRHDNIHPFIPRSFLLSPNRPTRPRAPRGCCRFCPPVQSCTGVINTTGVTNGPRATQENGPKLGRASGSSTPRCAALRWRWSMPVRVRMDDQDQPNPMVLSALEEARYARSPSYGYEGHGSF